MAKPSPNRCILNLGLYKTGTTTLAEAARSLGLKVHDQFPSISTTKDDQFEDSFTFITSSTTLKNILLEPTKWIDDCIQQYCGRFVKLFIEYDYVSDGWISLLPLASPSSLQRVLGETRIQGVELVFVCTRRDNLDAYLESELHHWVRHDIEKQAALDTNERRSLLEHLKKRYQLHQDCINRLSKTENICRLPLECLASHDGASMWAELLSSSNTSISKEEWEEALKSVGKQNSASELPIEGILLTMRIVQNVEVCLEKVQLLLDDIERDPLCAYMVVLAIDDDEYSTPQAERLEMALRNRKRMQQLIVIRNPINDGAAPKICQIWDAMAQEAFQNGASWVVFLGDDIRIPCPFHYRAIYRFFLDMRMKFGLPVDSFFGCSWFNDKGFPGFPTFPIIGRDHYDIFGGCLIPEEHKDIFVNQDLDPYLQRIYLKFGAAPCLTKVDLVNECGGSDLVDARYPRVSAKGWRDRVLEQNVCVQPIRDYLHEHGKEMVPELLMVDVVIPSYRIGMEYLRNICSIEVPEFMRTTFIIIIDNPLRLINLVVKQIGAPADITYAQAASIIESDLARTSCNNIQVRCNQENLGASASRNYGINESAAEYILFLDDDVIPAKNILRKYGEKLVESIKHSESILGLLGLVRFPRKDNMSVQHAAVFMSYLVFVFEIADSKIYQGEDPPWGVTANILFKKFPGMCFDTRYAKTGGGEDVDFALRLSEENGNLRLKACPSAKVEHLFWSDQVVPLCKHFYNWAVGDSALFHRWSSHVYTSYPNFVETWVFLVLPSTAAMNEKLLHLCLTTVFMFVCDVILEMGWKGGEEFRHRCRLLEQKQDVSKTFAIASHVLANFYVIVLEFGRLHGHLKRRHFTNVTRRFDWHCGRLEYGRKNFVEREKAKLIAFLLCLVVCSILL